MPDKFTRETKLAAFLVLAAVSPVVSWYMLLFVAKPMNVSVAAAAWSELTYVFGSENADRWWFVLWALLPVLLLTTAFAWGASGFLCVRRVAAGRRRGGFRQASGHLTGWAS